MSNGSGTPVQSQYKFDGKSYQLVRFTTPACNADFPPKSTQYEQLAQAWSQNVDGFTNQAITGNPWNAFYQSQQTAYYNPLRTPIPANSGAVDVAWIAFPNRLVQYLGQAQQPPNPYNLTQAQLYELADTGALAKYSIPVNKCPQADWDPKSLRQVFGPYGPRGWLDEYCEFSVVREGGKITRIDFTCENPEYFQTLWRISPDKVAEVYQNTLNYGVVDKKKLVTVTVDDLKLFDPKTKKEVIDPQTGKAAYNPLNKWNTGTSAVRNGSASTGGAMHLTATPNTIQTELALGSGATVQRTQGNTDPQALICCGQYGQNYRNSDPHIGQSINLAVGAKTNISLADPPGLYIQMPSFAQYVLPKDPKLPPGASAADCWQIVRGFKQLVDPITNAPFPGSFILHAVFQIPQSWIAAGVKFTVGDITIAGQPIQWASQVQSTLEVALFGRPIPPVVPAPAQACVTSTPPNSTQAQPLQIMYQNLWDAYYGTPVSTPMGMPMVLASNSSIIPPTVPPTVKAGQQNVALLALTYAAPTGSSSLPKTQWPTVVFTLNGKEDKTITTKVLGFNPSVTYAVPGNTYPSVSQLLNLQVSIAKGSPAGVRGVVIVPAGQVFSNSIIPAPAFLVVANA